MKTLSKGILGLVVIIGLSCVVHAQPVTLDTSSLELVPRDELPRFGTFWIERATGLAAPLPCPPGDMPDAPTYALPNGQFLVDATAVQPATMTASSMSVPFPDGGGGSGGSTNPPPPDIRRNYQKFMNQIFALIDTNAIVSNGETDLYKAFISLPAASGSSPTLQIKPYGSDAVLIRADHFDYSAETDRDFALLICDSIEKPVWKTVYLNGSSDAQDGWLIQGLVNRQKVADPMYMLITNIAHDCNAFLRAIPYSGPQVTLLGAQAYGTVSNMVSLTANITDLSGTTNESLTVLVNGMLPRYSISQNSVSLDTRYTPNGVTAVSIAAHNSTAMLVSNPTNPPADTKLDYDATVDLPLDFENKTYVYFPNDSADPAIGTNWVLYGVTPPQYIRATITEPNSGRILKSFSGYDPSYAYVELDWNFTESDGTTPYTSDQYAITFTASDTANGSGTTLSSTNKIERNGIRTANWVIMTYEKVDPSSENNNGSWIDSEMDRWANTIQFMYETLYFNDFASQSQYFAWQIGSGRDNPSYQAPYGVTKYNQDGWRGYIHNLVTNRLYSDFNYGPGHGNGYTMGGGEYAGSWLNWVNASISANEMLQWAQSGAAADRNWKFRKVTMWACYSARIAGPQSAGAGLYGNWHNAFGISPYQLNTLAGKNVGLFFNDDLRFVPYGTSPVTTVAEVAAEFDKIWVMGANPFPGGADPNYSFQFAYGVTVGLFPELTKAKPIIIGCPYLPYAGVYDGELRVNDYHQVK